jgi:hypothetical protein
MTSFYDMAKNGILKQSSETNPKDLIGATKISTTKIPDVAIAHCAAAMMDGARRYGSYNWRSNAVQADIYIDAARRHLAAWMNGERVADDSKVHHLGHAMACCAILLDAEAEECLVDNRPKTNGAYLRVAKELNEMMKEKEMNG